MQWRKLRKPTKAEVARAKAEIEAENAEMEAARRVQPDPEIERRTLLPPEDPEHLCGPTCDGQDGSNSYCTRLRQKLFGWRG